MPTKTITKTEAKEDNPSLFDHERHATEAEAARRALAEAEGAVPDAEAAAEAAADALMVVEAELGQPHITASVLSEARLTYEVAQAQLGRARTRRATAQLLAEGLNTDTSAAEALLPVVARLVHPSVEVLAVPGPLHRRPELADLRPVVALLQDTPSELDPAGWVSTREHRPVLVEVHYVDRLHAVPTNEDLYAAATGSAGVRLSENNAHQMRPATETTYTNSSGDTITVRTIRANIYAAAPALMTISEREDAATVGRFVAARLRSVLIGAGDPGSDVGGSATLQSEAVEQDVTTTRWVIRAGFSSRVGTHQEQAALFSGVVSDLVGRPLGGVGRITAARVTDAGVPEAQGSYYGYRDATAELTSVARYVEPEFSLDADDDLVMLAV